MKNLSLILNGVLFVAVAILFYLHFSKPAQTETAETSSKKVELPEIRTVNGAIGYINYDSLTEKYEFYKDSEREINTSLNRKKAEFDKKQGEYEEALQRYQQLAPSLNDQARGDMEGRIMKQEQELVALRDKLTNEQATKVENFNKKFLGDIDTYLRELSKKKNYSYVFTYSKGMPATIVFANDSLEITNEVINGLNKAYKEKKK